MPKAQKLSPGQKALLSGQYAVIGPKGGKIGIEVTVPKGHHFPPTQKPGQKYQMVDPTKNKSGRN